MAKNEIEELHNMVKSALANMKEVTDQAITTIESERDSEDSEFQIAIDRGISSLREVSKEHQEKIADRALEIKKNMDPAQGEVITDDLDFIAGGTFVAKELRNEERRIRDAAGTE